MTEYPKKTLLRDMYERKKIKNMKKKEEERTKRK